MYTRLSFLDSRVRSFSASTEHARDLVQKVLETGYDGHRTKKVLSTVESLLHLLDDFGFLAVLLAVLARWRQLRAVGGDRREATSGGMVANTLGGKPDSLVKLVDLLEGHVLGLVDHEVDEEDLR